MEKIKCAYLNGTRLHEIKVEINDKNRLDGIVMEKK